MNKIIYEQLEQLKSFGSTMCLDALRTLGVYRVYIEGSYAMQTGMGLAGLAVTLRMLPERPDLSRTVSEAREKSAEYLAMEKCSDLNVLVIDAMGWQHDSVGGDIKFLRLKQKGAKGIVTDGAIRDMHNLRDYGLTVFAGSQTAKAGPLSFLPAQEGLPIQCGGVLVCPGDALVGDDSGVVVIPHELIENVVAISKERIELESFIKQKLETTPQSPGKYYPINEQIEREFAEWKRR